MELGFRWSWLLVVLLYGSGLSSSLVRPRRQSDTWWRSHQSGRGSSRGLGQPASRLGSSRGAPWSQSVSGFGSSRAAQPVSGWGSRYPGREYQSRQLLQPPSSPISVQCAEDRMVVTVMRDFYGNGYLVKPSDLTLGTCTPITLSVDNIVVFDNAVQACGSSLQMTPDFIIYSNVLKYNPVSGNTVIMRSNPASVPITCYYPRHGNVSSKAVRPTWSPFSTTVSTEERLAFSMYLMNDDWSARRASRIFQLGDSFNIEASVDTANHVPMIIFVESCVATTTLDITSNPRYELIASNGCLVDGTEDDSNSAFRSPRLQPDKIQFMVDAFRFIATDVSTIYITCSLRAAPANQPPDQMHKACSYNKATRSWSPVEGPNDICRCCDSGNCAVPSGQTRRWGSIYSSSRGVWKRDVGGHPEEHVMTTLGPLLIINADKSRQEPEHIWTSRVSEESRPLELWMLVAVGSASVVVVVVSLVVIGRNVVKRLSLEDAP